MDKNGNIDEELLVEEFTILMKNHDKKVEASGNVNIKEEITPMHELVFNLLELQASSRPISNTSVAHCLAKLCILFFAHKRPEAFINGKGKRKNIFIYYY